MFGIVILYSTPLSSVLLLFLSFYLPHDSVKGIDQSIYIKRLKNYTSVYKRIHLSKLKENPSIKESISQSFYTCRYFDILIYILEGIPWMTN
jgi:hypothetical protein